MPNEEVWQDKLVYDAEINAFVFDPRGKRKKDVCLNETDVFPHIRHIHTMRSLCLIVKAKQSNMNERWGAGVEYHFQKN